MWEIKGKDDVTKATVYALEYNGEWMGEVYVSVTIESPTPIDFAIGDYLMYRGERFEINYNPGKIKSAPQYAKGDAFKYENVKFNSFTDELTRCVFHDVVLNDNRLHFTGLPKFPFHGGVQDLADRIQANLDRAYGKNTWTVVVSPEYTDNKELNVTVDTQKVWDMLSVLVNDFKTYFTIKGRTITIGAAGVPAGHLFKYGKDNGLYEIEENAEPDQAIITRLRAYGSTRNLPHRYYNSLTGSDGRKLIPDNMAVQNLMLPNFPYGTQDPFIDSANRPVLGTREGTVFFDGSQEDLDEIYPSIEGMTAEQLKAAGVTCNATGALDEIVSATQVLDNGVGKIEDNNSTLDEKYAYFKVTVKDLGFNIKDCILPGSTPTVAFKSGMLGGREFEIVASEPIKNAEGKVTGCEIELKRVYDDDIKLWFPYNNYNAKAGDKFVLLYIQMPEAYIKAASQRLLEAAKEWLAKNDYSRSVYAPKVDEIFMARQHDAAMASNGTIASLHDTLCAGMMLLFEDEDLNIDASIFIDQLTIKEGEGAIPTYEVTLKEEKTVGRLDKMQNQIDSLASGGQGGGYTAAQIRSMIDAYGGTRFLSKIKSDRTPYDLAVGGELIAEGATRSKDFASGMTGYGWRASASGEIEAASLTLRKFLEVPELRFNRATVVCGTQWRAAGGGLIESVEITDDTHGTAYLKLEDGEIGAIAVGDLCMGVFHKTGDDAGNATADSDDRKGNFTYAGFTTVYFRINSVSADLKSFTYELRPGHTEHPSAAMNFVGYGNDTDTGRQKCWYATRTYERYLSGVSGWEFTEANIMMQTGDLSGLTVGGESLSGYSAYLNNVFFSGTIRQVRDRITQYADNLMSGTLKFSEPWEALGNTELRQKYQDFMIARCDNTAEASGATEVMPMLRGTAPVETGKIYTLSFWAKGSGQMRVLMYTATSSLVNIIDIATTGKHGGTAIGRYPGFNLTDEWTRHYIVFRAATDSASVDKAVFFQAMSNTDASLIAVKLEEGDNRQPAWTPSAEDMLGKKGDVGPAGAVMRIRGLFDASAAYADGTTADADGIRWVDVVWVESATGTRYYYTCANSAGAALNAPTASADGGNANWSPMSDLGNVYADMIFARNAHIDFLSGQEIVFGETQSDGTTKVHGRIGVPKSMYVMYDPISLTSDEADTETNVDSGVSPQSAAARIGTSTSTGTGTGAVTPGGDISIPIVTNGYAIDGIIMWLGGASADVATMTMQKTGLTTFGQYNKGRRIEVDPSNKEIRVFNDSGKLSVLIDGDTHTVDDLFKVDKHLVSDVGLPFSSSTPDDSPYSLGYFKTESNGHVKIACTVTISAQSIFIPATLGSPSNPSTGFSRILRGSAGVKLVLLKSNGKEQLSSSVFYEEPTNYLNNPPTTVTRTNSNKTMNLSIEGDIPADTGEYRAQLIVTINKPTDTESGETATASTIVRIKKGDADFTPVADPRAMLCANGLIVANSSQNYLTAGVHGSEGFIIEGRVGNNGIKINSEGIWALNAQNQYSKIKLTLM